MFNNIKHALETSSLVGTEIFLKNSISKKMCFLKQNCIKHQYSVYSFLQHGMDDDVHYATCLYIYISVFLIRIRLDPFHFGLPYTFHADTYPGSQNQGKFIQKVTKIARKSYLKRKRKIHFCYRTKKHQLMNNKTNHF